MTATRRWQAGRSAARAASEVVREAKSAYWPTVYGSVTGAAAQDGTRITAGALNNPTVFDRFATGVTVSQLVTDFGRTGSLVETQKLRANAQEQNATLLRAEVLLRVDQAYFDALRAVAVLRVARQTVEARQLVVDQVTALAASNLKSGLDVSFARVNLSQSQLLLVQAQSEVDASLRRARGRDGRAEAGDLRPGRRADAFAARRRRVGAGGRRLSGSGPTSPRSNSPARPPRSSHRPSTPSGIRRWLRSASPVSRPITRTP